MIDFLKSKQFFKHLGLALACLGIVLWSVFLFLSSYTLHGKTISVPKLEGLALADAQDKLIGSKLNVVVVDSVFNSDIKGGIIIDQNPSAGFNVKLNRTVYLTINSFNPPLVKVPNIVDQSLRQAEATLESYGLRVGNTSYVPNFAKNLVIKQRYKGNDLRSGTELRRGSKVDLVLGDGLKGDKVPVPSVIGMLLHEANQTLLNASLSLGGKIYDATVKDTAAAKVYRQSPNYGNAINAGRSVDIFFTEDASKISIPADTTSTP